jgi:hypothetical protein
MKTDAVENVMPKIGWYGWLDYEGKRREAFVEDVIVTHYPGEEPIAAVLVVNLAGIPSVGFNVDPEDFTPDPDAQFWTGHCPDEVEDCAALDELRARMIAEGWEPDRRK